MAINQRFECTKRALNKIMKKSQFPDEIDLKEDQKTEIHKKFPQIGVLLRSYLLSFGSFNRKTVRKYKPIHWILQLYPQFFSASTFNLKDVFDCIMKGKQVKTTEGLRVVFKRTFCSAEQFGHFQAELFCSAEPNIYLKSSALAEHPKILYF